MRGWSYRLMALVSLLCLAIVGMAQDEVVTQLSAAPDPSAVQLTPVVEGLVRPLYVTHAPGDDALYVVEQGGRIKRAAAGEEPTMFLDMADMVIAEANGNGYTERGLLGLAFSPDFAENGVFFVNYSDTRGNTVIARYTVSADDATMADPTSGIKIFTQEDPLENHNGGHMAFGPDGYLYVATGDGGGRFDPLKTGQDLQTLFGKILRLDVSGDEGYTIPADNPFVNGGGLPEIWSYGLRNPWRFSFDRGTGDLYIADVGQNKWEEVNFQPADSTGGENYGWSGYEGTQRLHQDQVADNAVMPIAEYAHDAANGCSITGGYVYRGAAIPSLQGAYLYSDYCAGRVWITYRDESDTWQTSVFLDTGMQVSSFGEDAEGNVYIVSYAGTVYRIDPA